MVGKQTARKSKLGVGSPKKTSQHRRTTVVSAANPACPNLLDVRRIRIGLGIPRHVFARLSGYSERALAEWEAGKPLSESSRQRMFEMDRLRQALGQVMRPDFIGTWLKTPNDGFEGLKPLEVVERGQIDRIWQMIYLLESGQPG